MGFLSLTLGEMVNFRRLKHNPPGKSLIGLPGSFIRKGIQKGTQKGTQKGGLNRRRRRRKNRFTRKRKR